jgi:hypothetical protein
MLDSFNLVKLNLILRKNVGKKIDRRTP